jgi:anthranilate/para-aminobenzoate synthase component I
VADSQPEREYQETLSKARALGVAVELAEQKACNAETEKEKRVQP